MSSTKEAQAARSAADRRLREEHKGDWMRLMAEEHAKRDLTWSRRATPAEREAIKAAQAKASAAKRIKEMAERAGLTVDIDGLGVEVDYAEQGDITNAYDQESARLDESDAAARGI
jgi:hypothetical protein